MNENNFALSMTQINNYTSRTLPYSINRKNFLYKNILNQNNYYLEMNNNNKDYLDYGISNNINDINNINNINNINDYNNNIGYDLDNNNINNEDKYKTQGIYDNYYFEENKPFSPKMNKSFDIYRSRKKNFQILLIMIHILIMKILMIMIIMKNLLMIMNKIIIILRI